MSGPLTLVNVDAPALWGRWHPGRTVLEDDMERLRAHIPETAHAWCDIDELVCHGDPAAEVEAAAERVNADTCSWWVHRRMARRMVVRGRSPPGCSRGGGVRCSSFLSRGLRRTPSRRSRARLSIRMSSLQIEIHDRRLVRKAAISRGLKRDRLLPF